MKKGYFKRIFSMFALLFIIYVANLQAADITELSGYTGQIGKEDINYGTGEATDTFTVPTYSGGTTTLTKVPSPYSDQYSKIKNVWYVNNAATITDHGAASGANYTAGNLKKLIDLAGSDEVTIELPGDTNYPILTNLTIPANVTITHQRGAIFTGTGDITYSGSGSINSGHYEIFNTTGNIGFAAGTFVDSAWLNSSMYWDSIFETAGITISFYTGSCSIASASVNAPANTYFNFSSGSGTLNIASGKTLTIYSSRNIIAGSQQQIKTGAGTLLFSATSEAYPDWFTTNAVPGITDMSEAVDEAMVASSGNVLFNNSTYLVSGITYTGKTTWRGRGDTNIISDSTVLTVTDGDKSFVKDINFENITAPLIVTRDFGTWSSESTTTSNTTAGYQPTINDTTIWSGLTAEQKAQDIGPKIIFITSDNVDISGLTGRFFSILLYGCSNSTVHNNTFKGNKAGLWGSILFWNATVDGYDPGYNNKAIDNIVYESSYSGITFCNNYQPIATGNSVYNCGETGIKLVEMGTGYACYNSKIENNILYNNYYDGIDAMSTGADGSPTYDSTFEGKQMVQNNTCFGNRTTGITINGSYNIVTGNYLKGNGTSGIHANYTDNSLFSNNFTVDNNQLGILSGYHQLAVVGDGNFVIGNTAGLITATVGNNFYIDGASTFSDNHEIGTSSIVVSSDIIDASYSTGSYSPTLLCSVSGAYLISSALDTLAYTKTGRMVTVQGVIEIVGELVTPSGDLRLSLPFTVNVLSEGQTYAIGNVYLSGQGSTLSGQLYAKTVSGQNYCNFVLVAADGTETVLDHDDVDTAFFVVISISYVCVS